MDRDDPRMLQPPVISASSRKRWRLAASSAQRSCISLSADEPVQLLVAGHVNLAKPTPGQQFEDPVADALAPGGNRRKHRVRAGTGPEGRVGARSRGILEVDRAVAVPGLWQSVFRFRRKRVPLHHAGTELGVQRTRVDLGAIEDLRDLPVEQEELVVGQAMMLPEDLFEAPRPVPDPHVHRLDEHRPIDEVLANREDAEEQATFEGVRHGRRDPYPCLSFGLARHNHCGEIEITLSHRVVAVRYGRLTNPARVLA